MARMLAFLVRLFGLLLLLSAVAVPLARAPDREPETLVARWAPTPSDFIGLKGMAVHIRDEGPRGDPLPIVLIHGAGASLHTWEGWAAALKAQRRVITFDLPGAGLTGPFTGDYATDDYRPDQLARFTLDLMDRLRLQRVVLGGHSTGGEVAWRVAALAPQRVGQLILVDATGLPSQGGEAPLGLRLASLPVGAWLSQFFMPRALVETSLRQVYADPRRITPALVDRYFELNLRSGNRHALALTLAQRSHGEDAARLDGLTQRTLILWGDRDPVLPPAQAAQFARRIAGSRAAVLEGLGHAPQEEDPQRSVRVVHDFLGLR
jgi:pimeloyl-ACP methyl ester carboxylesterase